MTEKITEGCTPSTDAILRQQSSSCLAAPEVDSNRRGASVFWHRGMFCAI